MKDKLQKKEKDIEKYRKRLLGEKAKYMRNLTDSPRTKTKKITQRPKCFQRSKRKTKRAIVNILPSKTFYLPSYRESTD